MSAKWHRGAPELTWGTLWVTCDNSPTFDGTGPQNAPEGTVDMNSIDNLREYVLTAASVNATTRAVLAGYVDEIEREVEELRDRDYRNGREDAKGAVEFADRLKAAVDNREDVTLFGIDYIALPVDADGMPWHINDEFEVDEGIAHVNGIGDNRLYYIDNDGMQWTRADNKIHHHALTVEDVLREFAQEMNENLGMYTGEAIDADEWRKADERTIAEYAAKLQLKED